MALNLQQLAADTSPITRSNAQPGIFPELGNAFRDLSLNLFRAGGDRLADAIRGRTTTPASDATQDMSLGGFGDLLRAAGANFGQGAADGAGASSTAKIGAGVGIGAIVLIGGVAAVVALLVGRR